MNIGERIQKIRKEKSMTQEELAGRIGVKRAVISKYENGSVNMSVPILEKIADALEVSVIELMLGIDKATLAEQQHIKDINIVFKSHTDKRIKNNTKIADMNSEELAATTETLDFLDTITSPNQTSQQVKEQDAHIRAAISERRKVLEAFDTLNSLGKEKALERVEELTEIPKYTTPDSPDDTNKE